MVLLIAKAVSRTVPLQSICEEPIGLPVKCATDCRTVGKAGALLNKQLMVVVIQLNILLIKEEGFTALLAVLLTSSKFSLIRVKEEFTVL